MQRAAAVTQEVMDAAVACRDIVQCVTGVMPGDRACSAFSLRILSPPKRTFSSPPRTRAKRLVRCRAHFWPSKIGASAMNWMERCFVTMAVVGFLGLIACMTWLWLT